MNRGIIAAVTAAIAAIIIAQTAPEAGKPANGKKLFEKFGCIGCHMVGNKGGKTGPLLSTVGSKHDAVWFDKKLTNPKEFNPNSIMPALSNKVAKKDRTDLIAFLASLKEPAPRSR
jgi:cytochrome c2